MSQVFISYAKSDFIASDGSVIPGSALHRIMHRLDEEGISYWIDFNGLVPGEEFPQAIYNSIKSCDVFLFLSTKASNASKWTLKEIAAATDLEKTILPVRLDGSPYDEKIVFYLSPIQYVDWREQGPHAALEKMVAKIKTPSLNLATGVDYGKLPKFTSIVLYFFLGLLITLYAILTYLYLWPQTLNTNEVEGAAMGYACEAAILLSVYYTIGIIRRKRSLFILPAFIVLITAVAYFIWPRTSLAVGTVSLAAYWVVIFFCCLVGSKKRAPFFKQMGSPRSPFSKYEGENLILLYLTIKAVVVAGVAILFGTGFLKAVMHWLGYWL